MFNAKILRTTEGIVTITLKSSALETLFKAFSGGKTFSYSWMDGTIKGTKSENIGSYRGWKVPTTLWENLDDKMYTSSQTIYLDGGSKINLLPLVLCGLGEGIEIQLSSPVTATGLKAYHANLEFVVARLFEYSQPVDIELSIRKEKAP